MFQPHSPGRRRESSSLLEKIRSDNSLTRIRINVNADKKDDMSSAQSANNTNKEQLPMLKYISSQVCHCDLDP